MNNNIRQALEYINFNYGKGSIGKIQLFFDGNGIFEQIPYNCRAQKRKFRIYQKKNGKITVFALNHQKTI